MVGFPPTTNVSSSESSIGDVSQLLAAWADGDTHARDRLLPLVYGELRRLARRQLRRERAGCSLQSTDLVNEAYLRLVQQRDPGWRTRTHFLAMAARIMRRILVDRARRRRYLKRGGDAVHLDLESGALVSPAPDMDVAALDEALQRLEHHDRRKSAVVELRYFGGLTVEEISEFLGVSPITVKRDWSLAKAWLHREMTRAHTPPQKHPAPYRQPS